MGHSEYSATKPRPTSTAAVQAWRWPRPPFFHTTHSSTMGRNKPRYSRVNKPTATSSPSPKAARPLPEYRSIK